MDMFRFRDLVDSRKVQRKKMLHAANDLGTGKIVLDVPQGSPTFDEILEGHHGELSKMENNNIGMD